MLLALLLLLLTLLVLLFLAGSDTLYTAGCTIVGCCLCARHNSHSLHTANSRSIVPVNGPLDLSTWWRRKGKPWVTTALHT